MRATFALTLYLALACTSAPAAEPVPPILPDSAGTTTSSPADSPSSRLATVTNVVVLVGGGATGFFVRSDDEFFLVTAQHVVEIWGQDPLVYIAKADGTPAALQLSALSEDSNPLWSFHDTADVAVAKLRDDALSLLGDRFLLVSNIKTGAPPGAGGQTPAPGRLRSPRELSE